MKANLATPAPAPRRKNEICHIGQILRLGIVLALSLTVNAQTTNYWCDGFENLAQSLDCWNVSSGTWEFGVPTSGPGGAHNGTNVAATVLAGNYAENTSSRLESCSFVVPASSDNPRLRFWHWFNFNCGDHGQVQIKVGASNWAPLTDTNWGFSSTFSGYSGGTWSYPSFDLSAYAGQTVQIGFLFSSSGCNGFINVAPGWYIDEVCVLTGPLAAFGTGVVEGFEATNFWSNWSSDNGTWEWGVPTSGPGAAHQGSNVIATILGGNYGENTSSLLVGPSLVVPAANQKPSLRFWHWYNFNCGDSGEVMIKAGTNNWQSLDAFAGYSGYAWAYPCIDLTAYAGQTVRLGFYFSSSGCNGFVNVAPGWYIDELVVVTNAGTDLVAGQMESFEGTNFWSNWCAENGTWEWGVPTNGPGAAHQGSNVIATVLSGNYGENTSSLLVSPSLSVPAGSQNPRLRFWHWFSFNCGDYGQVWIKVGTNNWQFLSGQYTADSSGYWSHAWLDLSAWAGQTVQLGFYFSSSGCNGFINVAPGWYIDELIVETGPLPMLSNPEDFESGQGGWLVDYIGGQATDFAIWQIGQPTYGAPTNSLGLRAHSGTNCAATVLNGDYPENRSARLVSPPFVVPPAITNPQLKFWQWYSFNCGDYGQLQIKPGTNDWQTVATFSGNSGSVWSQPGFPLSDYAGEIVQLGFYFSSSGCNGFINVAPGWYIDDVRLQQDYFALLLLDSPIVRTQNMACVSLGIGESSPASTVSFALQAPPGHLTNLVLNTEGCWMGTITPQPNSQWLVTLQNNLQNSCTNAPMGVKTVGSICFTALGTESAFVPLTVSNLVVSNLNGSLPAAHGFGNRTVIIANKPLLEAGLGPNLEWMLTTFGKANTSYEILYSTNLVPTPNWTLSWTNPVPASMFYMAPVQGAVSNTARLFLEAKEK